MKKIKSFISLALLVIISLVVSNCETKVKKPPVMNPEFSQYISAYTSGVISCESVIRVRLVSNLDSSAILQVPVQEELFSFSPSIAGNVYLIDKRTIEFRPDKKLKHGEVYDAEFYLGKLLEVSEGLSIFSFQFQTIKQSFEVFNIGFNTYSDDKTLVKVTGTLISSDVIEQSKVEKIVNAEMGNVDQQIRWVHKTDRINHNFTIDSIKRLEGARNLLISWDGKPIGIEVQGKDTIEIPAIGIFKILDVKVNQRPKQEIIIRFSDPIDKKQNLKGLIRLVDGSKLRCIIDGNQIKAFPENRESGENKLLIEAGIKSVFGKKLKEVYSLLISFKELEPAVELIGDGVILPNSDGLILPFKAVNLKAVDVEIIKIFENNIGQFLQVNNISGNYQLRRVGRPVLRKTVKLTSDKPLDLGKWNTFSLDLTDLIKNDPGAIYRVEFLFRKQYSLYSCGDNGNTDEDIVDEDDWDSSEEEPSYWDNAEYYYYYYPPGYQWKERDNPCHISYYNQNRFKSKNILTSDLGIIAKESSNNIMTVIVTNLLNAEPVKNVDIELYNYQQQLIGRAKTNNQGITNVDLNSKAYYLKAIKGKHSGYLRVDDGTSLSLSKFDVSGKKVDEGIKGFIYGDRGVWRPGDSLYLTFILEDKDHLLPQDHPVVFEMINPQGQLVERTVKIKGLNNFYDFRTKTKIDALTGNWTAKVKVGGASFSKRIKIETVKPNRLKIKLEFGTDCITVLNRDVKGELSVKWLTGAIARNLKAKIDVMLSQTKTKFDKYQNYIFDDPSKKFFSDEETIFDGKINDRGIAMVSVDFPKISNAPGMLKANFSTKVFEESGEFSIDYFSIKYAPYKNFVGIMLPEGDKRNMLLTDTTHTVDVVTVNTEGMPVSVNNLKIKIYKVQWRWWWNAADDDIASYFSSTYKQPILEKSLSTKDGHGEFSFKIKYPEWGRYFIHVIDEESGHSTGKTFYIDWPGWAGKPQIGDPQNITMLVFDTDKEKYEVGEKCTVTFPSGGVGRALVSVESGSKVIETFWIQAQPKQTSFSFKLTPEMAPNIYINITLIQPHSQTVNDLPIRLYGVIPVIVENPETLLYPEIQMPDVLKPEENVSITISEKNNKPITYTIAVVDEGLLDLTHFKTPSPWNSFYAREALGVKTWDMYKYVIGAFGGTIEQMFAIGGGGEEMKGSEKKRANRFKPVVIFMGPFKLEKGKQTHTFRMPNYVGSVRTMLVAGDKGAFGSTEKTTPVKKPLMVLATLPRVLGPDESASLPVTVFAMEDNIKEVTVNIKTNEYFTVSENTKHITFDQTGDKVVNFELKVKPDVGIGKVNVTVQSGQEKASYDIEIEIRNPNPPVTRTISGVMEPGKTWETNYTLPGIDGTNSAVLEISGVPPMNLEERLSFLIRYPYGCAEQTISSVFPQLYLNKLMEIDSKTALRISENIKNGINRMKSMQISNGGIAYWPNSTMTNDWVTNYAGHFMLEAAKNGYTLPIGFKDQWISYQKTAADKWSPYYTDYRGYHRQSDMIQAYRLFTLALAGSPEVGAMNRLRENAKLSTQTRWLLAAAYVIIGQPEIAKSITFNLGTEIKKYTSMSETYGSSLRDRAIILYTFSLMNERSRAIPLMKEIAKSMSYQRWYSTQTTAFCLISLAEFIGNSDVGSKELKFVYKINQSKIESVNSLLPINQISVSDEIKTGHISIENKGDQVIYSTLTMTGIPVIGDTISSESNLALSVKYKDMKGNIIDVSKLSQSLDFMAEVTITNPGLMGTYTNMALTQIFPSGWEITNMRLADFESAFTLSKPTYQDIRDDRVYTFFDLRQGKSKTFVVLLNATYLGEFYLPSIYCEAMYDNEINARKAGKWIEIVEPGE